jgi:two-component sensor histidine kinase
VKNNLQTVAALLRLQSRRLDSASGRAALDEAVRRVAAIAVVHETLSQSFDESVEFDAVVDQLARLITDVGGRGDAVRIVREGSFGMLSSEAATPLAMVVTELMQNAVEHAYPEGRAGRIVVRSRRADATLQVDIVDDGVGLPAGFDLAESRSLGLSIVETLVTELGGSIGFGGPPTGHTGTAVRLELPVEATGTPEPAQPA